MVKRFKFLKPCRKLFGKIFIPEKCLIQSKTMFLHKTGLSFELAFEGIYEKLEYNHLKSLNLNGTVVIDAGSCIGFYSLALSDLVGKEGKVFAFEPEIKNFNLLKKNIAINDLTNIQAYNVAVGNKNSQIILKRGDSPGEHAVFENIQQGHDTSKVGIVRLDDFLKSKQVNLSKVSYVKIDVEGYEFEVLKGMAEIIKESDNLIIQFEFAPQHLEKHDCKYPEFINFLRSRKLNVSYWNFKNGARERINDLNWLTDLVVVQNFKLGLKHSRNLICSKKSI